MTILVFGFSGQVATELRASGRVHALSRDQADLRQPKYCADLIEHFRPSVVINAAAYTAVDAAERNEAEATLVNGDAPAEMAQAAANLGIPFLHISTDYVFDGTPGAAWTTSDLTKPLGAYGRSKLAGELGVAAAGGQHAILRTSWVFSAHGKNFVKTMLGLADSRDELNVVSDQVGGPTSAEEIAAALLTISDAMTAGNACSGTYHFAGSPETSWADFAREIFALSGKTVMVNDIKASAYPTEAKRPANSVLDCTGINRDFGITQPDWKAALARVIETLDQGGVLDLQKSTDPGDLR